MLYKLEETRLRQVDSVTSAANADYVGMSRYCPENKVWIVHKVGYTPSTTETQTVCFIVFDAIRSLRYGILNPISLTIGTAMTQQATCIEQGMELVLFPGENIYVTRGNHTAASTMTLSVQFTEIDLPLYTYEEPQVVKRQQRAISAIRSSMGGGFGGRGGGGGEAGGATGGGGSRSLPK